MSLNIIEKILKKHIVQGEFKIGSTIGIKIDQTLTQDATGTMAYLQFEALGLPSIKTELSVSYVDHNTLQEGFENADDHAYLQTIARKYGILYSKAGNGICHQVHLERFARPGKTLLGSDSHTPNAGGMGSLAIGAGGLDVALALSGEPFHLVFPKIMKINLNGKLRPWVSAKDIILKILQILTTKGNSSWAIEYGGSGITNLDIPDRATITNMGAELGVVTSIFPSDKKTLEFLKAQGRKKHFIKLEPDKDAKYDKIIDIDLDKLEPLAAMPHSPDNIAAVSELSNIKVNQVCIGSCTNSSFKDLMKAAHILKNKKIHPDVSLIIAIGSRQVFINLLKYNAVEIFLKAGARIAESACGFCIGAGHAPGAGSVSLRTSNRNFEGRCGTKDAKVYLVSPEVAAVSAVTGRITNPAKFGISLPKIPRIKKFIINDSMILNPLPKNQRKKITILRGPNIGKAPQNNPLPANFDAQVIIKLGDKITTDYIMPAGARLKYRSNIEKYSQFVFEAIDPEFYKKCLQNKKSGVADIIIAGESYGQGSSREHAAICPMFLGVKAVIAKSFERIHASNLINSGILPLRFENEKDYEKINQDDILVFENIKKFLINKNPVKIYNKTQNYNFNVLYDLTPMQIDIILGGGVLNFRRKCHVEF